MIENSLIDAGFLFAVFDDKDSHHEERSKAFDHEIVTAILPDVVLPEIAYLILREMNVETLVEFLRAMANKEYLVARATDKDLGRAAEILEQYNDNNIDLVDAVIVAMAERLRIKKILTVDRRHFSVFKPKHATAFEITP